MKLNEVQAQLERIARDMKRSEQRVGGGMSWTVDLPDGRTARYVVNGVPPLHDLDDHVRNALVNLWSMKDYLIVELESSKGMPKKQAANVVEVAANSSPALCLCADLANGIKHRQLTRSRSGR